MIQAHPQTEQINAARKPDGEFYLLYSVSYIGQKCKLTGALDCDGQLTLMPCAGTRYAARQNFCALADALVEPCGVLVVDALDFIHTKLAHFSASAAATLLDWPVDDAGRSMPTAPMLGTTTK